MISIEKIKSDLNSPISSTRRKASKLIGDYKIRSLEHELLTAYINEEKKKNSWETKYYMVLSLGLIESLESINIIEKIVYNNMPHDMITYAAAQTYVRLKRNSNNDASPCITLLKFGCLSVVDGALSPLGYDRMIPEDDAKYKLLDMAWDLHLHKNRIGKERGLSDPRYGLAAACAGWNLSITTDFLEHCIKTCHFDTELKKVAESSLKGKYIRLR